MKRVLSCLLLVLYVSLLLPAGLGQPTPPDLENSDAGRIVNATEQTREFIEERRWEYLSQEWKTVFLKSRVISTFDKAFRTINPVFFLFFGQDYDISLTFFIVVLIWFFFFYSFEQLLHDFASLSKLVASLISALVAIIGAHVGVYSYIATALFKVLFFKSGAWPWIAFTIFVIACISFVTFFRRITHAIGHEMAKHSEYMAKTMEEIDRAAMSKRMRGLENALDSVGRELR